MLRFATWSIKWSLALLFFLLVMAGAGYYVFMVALSGGQHVSVPQITGLPITEASYLLAEQGLELGKQTQVAHPSIPKYHVITQRPDAGRVVRTGRKVYPTVSMGASYMTAPDLMGKTLEDARREINQSRFRLGSVARIPVAQPRDTVLAQDPPAGRGLPSQGYIHLLISDVSGAEAGDFMPDIVGKSVDEARDLLQPYGLVLVPNVVDIPGAREDTVLRQDPPADAIIHRGDYVTYDVKPSGSVSIPDTRHQAEVRHEMTFNWAGRDVRVDLVDRRGNRQTVFSKPPLFDEQSRATYDAGAAIILREISYVGEAWVEIYVDGTRVDSYYLKDGAEPVRGR